MPTLKERIQSALDGIKGSFYKGDLVVIVTYTIPMMAIMDYVFIIYQKIYFITFRDTVIQPV